MAKIKKPKLIVEEMVEVVEESSPLEMARGYLQEGRYALAIQRANDYIKLKPNNDGAHRVLAEAYCAQGKFENALQAMTSAISLSEKAPSRQEGHKNYRNEIAEKYFEKLETDVEKSVNKKDLGGAVKIVETAQELTPDYTDAFTIALDVYEKIMSDGSLTEDERAKYAGKINISFSKANQGIPIRPAARRIKAATEFIGEVSYQGKDGVTGPQVRTFLQLDYHQMAHILGAEESKENKSLLLTPEKRQLIVQQKLLEMEKRMNAVDSAMMLVDDGIHEIKKQ